MTNKELNMASDLPAITTAHRDAEHLDFNQFRRFLEDASGISLGDNKQYLVTNRMRKLMDEYKIADFAELVSALKTGKNLKLAEDVIEAMTTNETFWFRDVYPYDHLKNVLFPQLMNNENKNLGFLPEPLRVWSAACSSGQEPYSISIMVEEYRQKNRSHLPRPVQIIATDLSVSVLEQARRGEYDKLSIGRGLSAERLQQFFDKTPSGNWRVKAALRDNVEFRFINLMDSYAALGNFDIVFCRNVLIYFNADLKRKILQKIHASLKPQGILFLGSSESLASAADLFEMVRCEHGIVYKAL
jgi:chemotaxis protein methyltransferase CheR